jgi:hypothetical protein
MDNCVICKSDLPATQIMIVKGSEVCCVGCEEKLNAKRLATRSTIP